LGGIAQLLGQLALSHRLHHRQTQAAFGQQIGDHIGQSLLVDAKDERAQALAQLGLHRGDERHGLLLTLGLGCDLYVGLAEMGTGAH
jgi:hypothetical protein